VSAPALLDYGVYRCVWWQVMVGGDLMRAQWPVQGTYGFRRLVLLYAAFLMMPFSLSVLAASESSVGPSHQSAIKLERTGVMYSDMGHPSLAEPLLEEALTLREHSVGLDHLTVATTLAHLASVYHALGKDDKAKASLQRALAIREKVLGASHPAVSAVQGELRLLSEHHFIKAIE